MALHGKNGFEVVKINIRALPNHFQKMTPLALRMLNIAAGYSNNTLCCSELNGEHAGECFRSLRHIRTPLWPCKAKKCHFSRKFDFWPDLTRPRTKKNMCNREISSRRIDWFFPRSSTTIRGRSPGGVVPTNPHWPSALWEMPWPGEG